MKDERVAPTVMCFYNKPNDYDVVTGIVGSFEIAFERRKRAFDNWHTAMGQMHRHLIYGGFGLDDRSTDIALIGSKYMHGKTA
jgi:hypothetical protein